MSNPVLNSDTVIRGSEDNRTLQQLAQEVLDVQNACNLSGVIHAWSRSISRLRKLLPNADGDDINRHPINIWWTSKCESLTGPGTSESYTLLCSLSETEAVTP